MDNQMEFEDPIYESENEST